MSTIQSPLPIRLALTLTLLSGVSIALGGCWGSPQASETSSPESGSAEETLSTPSNLPETVFDQPPSTPTVAVRRNPENAYNRRPAVLTDQVQPGSDFDQFRENLKQIIQQRDAQAIRNLASPSIKLSFGPPMTLDELNIDDPSAPFWGQLERIISIGCAPLEGETGEGGSTSGAVWICPHVFQAVEINDPYVDIFIVGSAVNVREQPRNDSAVVATLSNEVVQANPDAVVPGGNEPDRETNLGWQAIITPDGIEGYVSSRYAYSPIGYRAYFEQTAADPGTSTESPWTMTIFIAGD